MTDKRHLDGAYATHGSACNETANTLHRITILNSTAYLTWLRQRIAADSLSEKNVLRECWLPPKTFNALACWTDAHDRRGLPRQRATPRLLGKTFPSSSVDLRSSDESGKAAIRPNNTSCLLSRMMLKAGTAVVSRT